MFLSRTLIGPRLLFVLDKWLKACAVVPLSHYRMSPLAANVSFCLYVTNLQTLIDKLDVQTIPWKRKSTVAGGPVAVTLKQIKTAPIWCVDRFALLGAHLAMIQQLTIWPQAPNWCISLDWKHIMELVLVLCLPGCCAFVSFNTDCSKFLLAV